jgi:putative ABC transport system permease protein
MSLYNLKIAFRYLIKNKIYTTLIIAGFSIGFAVFMLIMFFYFSEKKVNKGFAHHKEIYRLYDSKENRLDLRYDFAAVLQSNYTGIVSSCPMDYMDGKELIAKDENNNNSVMIRHMVSTTNSFTEVFSVKIVQSLSGKLFDGNEAMSISRSLAAKLFNSENVLGNTLEYGNTILKYKGKITSVFEDLPQNSTFKADVLLNSENKEFRFATGCDDEKCWNLTKMYFRLNPEAHPEELISNLNKIRNLDMYGIGKLDFQRFDDIYLSELSAKDTHLKGNPKLLMIFLAIALVVLFLSAINYVNYMITQQYMKFRSIGISKTNGASWRQLASFTFSEAILGISIASVVSALLFVLILPFSESLFGTKLHLDRDIILQVAPIMLAIIILFILFISIFTLYFQTRFKTSDFMSGKRTRGKQTGKHVLLTLQLAVSIALIAVALGISKQLFFVKHADLGFNKELLLRINFPGNKAIKNSLKQEIEKLPFVVSTAYSTGCPGYLMLQYGSGLEDNNFEVSCIIMDENFIKTLGIEMIDGRAINPGDIDHVCYLNEAAVKKFGFEKIDGKIYKGINDVGHEIIGIVKNFHTGSFHNAVEPVALIYSPDNALYMLSIRIKPGNISGDLEQLKQVWSKLVPDELLNITFYDQQFQSMYVKDEKLGQSVIFFTIVAIALTCMGILSQIIVSSLIRTKEIGIRKVNGARTVEILKMLNMDFVKLVLIAFIIACPVSWYAMQAWLQNFASKTTMNWWVFASAGLIAMFITLITVSWQSWRAARMNPVEALRNE